MTDKKKEIMQSAIRLFSEKGYFSTSVQEIANDCRISKGSLYKFFESKEELLISIIEHNDRKMFQKAMNVNLDSSLSAKERLIKKVVVQLEQFINNKDFMIMLFQALPNYDNPRIPLLMKKIRANMMNWHKDCLIEAFGSRVESYIWDLVLMFQGSLKEYMFLIVHEHKDIDIQGSAHFVVECFDTMIHHITNPEPVLSSYMMKEYEELKMGYEPMSPEKQLDNLLEEINRKIEHLSVPNGNRQELFSAVESLHKEIHKGEPRKFLIKALLLYLGEIKELKDLVDHVESTYEKMAISKK